MKNIISLILLILLPIMAFSQSIVILRSLEISPNSQALVQFNNIFGNWENRDLDDSFPYVVIQMNLTGDANAIMQAKQKISLEVGTLYRVTSTDKNQPNKILFLVPKSVRNIYIVCGDGCENQLLHSGSLIENKVYNCTVQFNIASVKNDVNNDAVLAQMAAMQKQMEEMQKQLNKQQNNNNQTPTTNQPNNNIVSQNDSGEELFIKAEDFYKEKFYNLAVEYYRKAADMGHAKAQCCLGLCYYFGDGVDQNQMKALEWYRKSADQGYADAQYLLGWCYEEGEILDLNYTKAAEWYTKAAVQGNIQAQFNLGWYYENGKGVKQSYQNAAEWYRKAAVQGLEDAKNALARLYNEGKISSSSY